MNALDLDALLARPDVRRGCSTARGEAVSTGYQSLDACLGGGWPRHGLIEVLHDGHGGGELSLFAPLFRKLAATERHIAFVAPPCLPYPPALARWGLAGNFLLIESATGTNALWAAETCLRANCSLVLCWLDRPTDRALRRLQLAAEDGETLALLFRPVRDAERPSPAALRLAVRPHDAGLTIDFLKCRGRPSSSVSLPDPLV
ncbi:MAG TPA: translesion DNA synthesis-associated protein ImuA [Gammaproteobacteria bacterium]|nr:translesion DNA synthesis-associated protein ImuA [Gammaproteobacteria bacterium]